MLFGAIMHFLGKWFSLRMAPVMVALLSGVSLLASNIFVHADPILRGTSVQDLEIATALDQNDSGPAGDRSHGRIKSKEARGGPQQRLAEMHLEHSAAVCEAGCDTVTTPRPTQAPVSASASRPSPIRNDVVCVAGCYPDAGPEVTAAEEHSGAAAREWMAAPEPATSSQPATRTFRRWHDRINNPEAR